MKLYFRSLALISVLLSQSASAYAFQLNATGTKFQTMLDAYQNADAPARLQDFMNHAQPTCVVATPSSPDEILGTELVVQCGRVLTPATEAHDIPAVPAHDTPAGPGPLFPIQHVPATPAQHIPASPQICDSRVPGSLMLFGSIGGAGSATPEEVAAFSNTQTSTDLVINVDTHTQIGLFSELGDGVRISVRKNTQMNIYPFILETNAGIYYSGYCY